MEDCEGSRRSGPLALGAVVFAYDVGALAITFNYPLFIGQGGMEFWLLNAALFTAAGRSPPAPGGRRV